MTRRKLIILAVVLLCLIIAGTGYYLYNKPRTSAAAERAEAYVTARKLYEAFVENEQQANTSFVNKVVEVKGTVTDIQKNGNTVSILLEGQDNGSGGVNCSIATGEADQLPKVGEDVLIKGLCTGMLMDVSIVDATIINNK